MTPIDRSGNIFGAPSLVRPYYRALRQAPYRKHVCSGRLKLRSAAGLPSPCRSNVTSIGRRRYRTACVLRALRLWPQRSSRPSGLRALKKATGGSGDMSSAPRVMRDDLIGRIGPLMDGSAVASFDATRTTSMPAPDSTAADEDQDHSTATVRYSYRSSHPEGVHPLTSPLHYGGAPGYVGDR